MTGEKSYACIDYHYIRPDSGDPFPDIIGCKESQFRLHLEALQQQFRILTPEEVLQFSHSDLVWDEDKQGLFITFDDGTSDHHRASTILDEYGIKGLFFVPSCIYEGEPINPTIIHFCIEHFRIARFLEVYNKRIQSHNLNEFYVNYAEGDDVWKVIAIIKDIFRYRIPQKEGRSILLEIYGELFDREFDDALSLIHLTKEQTRDMLDRGHSLGIHTRTHVSIGGTHLSDEEVYEEIIKPKHTVEELFDTNIHAFSYPYGEKKDRLKAEELLSKTKEYDLVFTADYFYPGPNSKQTSPFELGRYAVSPHDDARKLLDTLIT